MCIAYLSLGHPDWPILIAANRDEFHTRPASTAGPWPDRPDVIAGQDLLAGGTWLGLAAGGRYALLTNYREMDHPAPPRAPSRGALVRDYLLGTAGAADYCRQIAAEAQRWAGFNLITGSPAQTWYLGNRDPGQKPKPLSPGVHVLSNHLLNTPWPKAQRLRQALDGLSPAQWASNPEQVFALMRDTTQAEPSELPATGLSLAQEQLLSSPFIVSPDYGTRCTTLIAIRADGSAYLTEQSYDASGKPTQRHDWWQTAAPGRRAKMGSLSFDRIFP